MSNKQVPEEIITDAFQISEDLKNGNIHNNRQFVQLSHVKELVASFPAKPSTPETKDKPATGSGGTHESILEKWFPQLGWTNTVRNRALAAMEECAAAKQPSPGGGAEVEENHWETFGTGLNDNLPDRAVTDKMLEAEFYVDEYIKQKGVPPTYEIVAEHLKISKTAAYARLRRYRDRMITKLATLRQPTGTVYVPTPITELPDRDNWYTLIVMEGRMVSTHAWYDAGHGWDLRRTDKAYTHWLRPIQFMPERVKMALPNAAQVLSGFIWKNEFPMDVIRGSIASGFEIHQQTLLTYLMKFVQFIEKGQSTGEGINE